MSDYSTELSDDAHSSADRFERIYNVSFQV